MWFVDFKGNPPFSGVEDGPARLEQPWRPRSLARRLRAARIIRAEVAVATLEPTTQNITVRLDRRTLRKAKILAAKRNTSISGLLAAQIETLVGEDDAYEQAHRRALALLDQGF